MNANQPIAALFDLDGVVFDSEPQYSKFWGEMGRIYHPEIEHFDQIIKGSTLTRIFNLYFPDTTIQETIVKQLNLFEHDMPYEYIPGVYDFLLELKEKGIYTAVVTSSNQIKMQSVAEQHPEFKSLFNRILTSEDFSASKPDPDCYLLGARVFNAPLENCMIFEDSISGIKAGMAANIYTVGLSTTNPHETIAPMCNHVIPNFEGFTVETMLNLLK